MTVIHARSPHAIFIAAVQLMESLETIRPGGWDIDYWLAASGRAHFRMPAPQHRAVVAGIQAKYLSSLAPDKPRWMTVSYFYPWWRLYATPEAENRAWIAQQFANGVNTGCISTAAIPISLTAARSGHARSHVSPDCALGTLTSTDAQSGRRSRLVFSRHTQDNYGGAKPHARYLDFVRGWYCALLEAHIRSMCLGQVHRC